MIRIISIIFLLFAFCYLIYPARPFPQLPPNSLQSFEPADTETTNRRAYYTNLDRNQVMQFYRNQFSRHALRLNYPPEESQTLIRDQTRSSWLEELYLPLRDSLLINGYYPKLPTEQINIQGVHYLNKITIRYVPSHPVTRLTVFLLSLVSGYFLHREYAQI